jgi:CheY-like chemotaxis protein
MGEPIQAYLQSSNGIYTVGYQQPNLTVTQIEPEVVISEDKWANVFHNPVIDELSIRLNETLAANEEVIIQLESQILKRLGYRVTASPNGIEALAAFRNTPKDFDLVITDMNMPNMTGDRLARKIIAVRPDIPIIICTGFSEKIGEKEARAIGVKEFLMKPVASSEMHRTVRKVLDGK